MELSGKHKAELVAKNGYVPGDLRSMAERIVALTEAVTEQTFAVVPTRPAAPGESESAAEMREHYRMWKLELGDWEIALESSGFEVHAFSENFRTGHKDARAMRESDLEGMTDFLVEAVKRAVADQPAPPGPR